MLRFLLGLLVAFSAAPVFAGGGFLRPPSYPLVAHDPYFSIWSPSEKFASTWATHWTGHVNALTSMARIDGKVVRLMGAAPADVPAMTQAGVDVYALRTLATFADGAVVINLSFMTPALPDDLDLVSRPITYITWEARSVDGKQHDVSIYFDTSAELCVNTPDQLVEWGREDVEGLDVMRVGSKEQAVLAKSGDDLRIDWGHAYLAVAKNADTHTVIASDVDARSAFVKGVALPSADDKTMPRAANDRWPVLAVTIDFGRVPNMGTTKGVMLGYDDEWSIRWMGQKLRPYWRRNGATMKDVLVSAEKDHTALETRVRAFDREFMKDLSTLGSVQYARMGSLAYRQCFAGNKLVADVNGQPLLFPKENFSNGCVGTVDVIYPMSPLFLWTSADLAKAMLVPVLEYASSSRWKFPFAPHDLGTYPHADGQVYGGGEKTEENQMPVEESANMILMVGALAEIEGNADFAAKYWPVLSKWAAYLESKGLDPENQLCTDDFAGHLAHNVNLSCKAILALGAYSKLCASRGMKDDAARWRQLAEGYVAKWITMAVEGDHTKLAFDQSGTWSQKYNLAWDRVLGLDLFPAEIKSKEMAFYRAHQQKYGLPLDSRATYTKLDWLTWTATITGNRDDFNALITPAYLFLDETPDRVPMSDWYETKDARKVGFIARPVVGGLFMPMIADRAVWTKWFARGAHSAKNWAALPSNDKSALAWADVLQSEVDPQVVTDDEIRTAITKCKLPWRIRDRATGIEMLLVPPGGFQCGGSAGDTHADDDERPLHYVTIGHAFYLSRYEVQASEWAHVIDGAASSTSVGDPKSNASFEEVSAFLKSADSTGALRLPTEHEWEYACRANTEGPRYGVLDQIAWYDRNSGARSNTVGSKKPNALGFHDMLGNVWEWCSDFYSPRAYDSVSPGADDPKGPNQGFERSLRGGSWHNEETSIRVSRRAHADPKEHSPTFGFRVARNP